MWTDEEYCMYIDDTDIVMVTDPGYDRGEWYTSEQRLMEPGIYRLVVDLESKRVRSSTLINEEYMGDLGDYADEYEDYIGVDAGLAGFFLNKPNFDEQEDWVRFLEKYVWSDEERPYYKCDWGLFTRTYDGDGSYKLYSIWDENKKIGLRLDFI